MVTIDQGVFSSLSCGPRMGAVFIVTFLAQAVVVVALIAKARKPVRYLDAIETIDDRPLLHRRRLIVFAIWCSVFTLVAVVCACTRTMTGIFVDSLSIIETSCIGPFSDTYLLDRSKVSAVFGYDQPWMGKRSSASTYLKLSQPNQPRAIYIDLRGKGNSRELIALAPKAMKDYDDYRSAQGLR